MKRFRRRSMLACALALLVGAAHVALGITVAPVTIGPSNDACDKAKSIGNVTNEAFDTTRATFDGPGHYMNSPNVWYCYTATCTGGATISLRGSSFDTKIAVYDGCSCYPARSALIQSNDDFHGQQSQATLPVTAGNQYLIEIGGYNSASKGPGVITVTCDGQACTSANDDCSKAQPVGNVTNMPFDTTCATFDGPGHCMRSPNIWYRYTAAGTGEVTVSLLGSLFDTKLAVYAGDICYPPLNARLGCNDDFGNSLASQVLFMATAGNKYLIEVGGYSSDESGQGVISITGAVAPPPPPPAPKDDCASARPVGNVTNMPFDTRTATFDGPDLCMRSPNTWYCYTASCTGDVTVSLLGSSFDTMLAVYNGCACPATQGRMIGCNDDFASSYQSQITFAGVAGNRYLIEVGGYGSETGQGVLSIRCEGAVSQPKPDLGDAPDSTNRSGKVMRTYPSANSVPAHFPTVFDAGSGIGPYGPAHLNDLAVAFLGKVITGETEADTGPDEDGENNIRPSTGSANRDKGDDAVAMPLILPDCGWAKIDYEVTIVEPGTDLWVNVWLDFNRDGDWDDTVDCPAGPAKEWAVQNQFLFDLPAGLNQITTPAFLSSHPANRPEQVWMRITLSELPWTGGSNPGLQGNAGSGPIEKYLIGETEDYYFIPQTTGQTECPLCEDVNGDGTINMEDLVAYVGLWLANCP